MTEPILVRYRIGEHVIEVRTTGWRTAYPRNGNVGNPTVYRQWDAYLDGAWAGHSYSTRWEAYEQARVRIDPDLGIRQHTVVKAEMAAARIKIGDQ